MRSFASLFRRITSFQAERYLMSSGLERSGRIVADLNCGIFFLRVSDWKPLKFSFEPGLFLINLVVCSVGITVVYFYLEESRNANLQNVGQEDVSSSEKDNSQKTMLGDDSKEVSGDSETVVTETEAVGSGEETKSH
uniref:Uncharacterized protein n=1 Tax=Caenorhabditis tropicalis TaxID=1561998 RepID=A0A1I7UYZ1_9PELO